MMHFRTIVLAVLAASARPPTRRADGPVIITFDKVEAGKPMASYTDRGVVFALSHPPTRSRATGRVMFFPHLKTPRKGILNAMANESIPVEVRFPKPAASVTLVLWGSIGSKAVVEACDAAGNVLDRASRDAVPERTGPEQPVPSFELTVKASAIACVRFSGASPGGYLVCDEVRFTPAADAASDPAAPGSPSGTLRRAVNGRFLIGTAVMSRQLDNPALAAMVAEQFDCLTGENEFKPGSLHPQPGRFNFAAADKIVEFARAPQHEGDRAHPLLARPVARLVVPGPGPQAAAARRGGAEPQGPHRRGRGAFQGEGSRLGRGQRGDRRRGGPVPARHPGAGRSATTTSSRRSSSRTRPTPTPSCITTTTAMNTPRSATRRSVSSAS